MTGSLGYSLRSATSVSRPFITGISISSVIRSGFNSGILARAIRPSLATPTTSSDRSSDRVSESSFRITTESSTTRMRMDVINWRTRLNLYPARRQKLGSSVSCLSLDSLASTRVIAAAGADLELLHQVAQLCGGFHQLLRRLLGVGGSARGTLRRLCDTSNVARDLAAAAGGEITSNIAGVAERSED